MAAIAKCSSHVSGTQIDIESLKTIVMFHRVGLFELLLPSPMPSI
jgi:hypothetical protein